MNEICCKRLSSFPLFNIFLLFLLFLSLPLSTALPDTLFLKNGGKIEGKIVKKENGKIIFAVEGGSMIFSDYEIIRIEEEKKEINGEGIENKKTPPPTKKKNSFIKKIQNINFKEKNETVMKFFKESYKIWITAIVAVLFLIFLLLINRKGKAYPQALKPRLQAATPPPAPKPTSREDKSFFKKLPSAFIYPFKSGGLTLLIIGMIFFGVLKILSFMPLGGWIFGVVGGGYLTAYLFKIVNTSALGRDEMPDWPDFTNFSQDILGPLLRMALTVIISFGPAIALALLGFFKGQRYLFISAIICGIGGVFYYPLAIVSTALSMNIHLNPFKMLIAIFKIFIPYMVACIILGLIFGINYFFIKILNNIFPILGLLVNAFLSFYITIVEMRILGILYYTNSDRLGWEELY